MNCEKCGVDLRGLESIKNKLDKKEYCLLCFYKYFLHIELPKHLNDSFTANI